MKKERWTESELLALPSGEHDYFERKSGDVLNDSGFREKLAKAVSAFANSGGGHLIIGVKDNGTVDGIPEVRGHTSTREWCEQLIPNLVSYPLQDFRVHIVEPRAETIIPTGRIVIVIDVGDSMLAPHQSESNKVYYYRAAGHSAPAPHHFLEVLREREGYPSQRIAYAWLNFVIAPWLRILEIEQENLASRKFGWNRISKTIENFSGLGPHTAVEIQFIQSYGAVKEAVTEHDDGISLLAKEVRSLVGFIEKSSLLADRYARATSSEAIREIRRKYAHLSNSYGASDAEMNVGLFGTMSREQQFSFLTELTVNQRDDLDLSMNVWPLWNSYGESFLEILDLAPVLHEWNKVTGVMETQLENDRGLVQIIENIRHELAFKYGEPYEDQTLWNADSQSVVKR